MNPKLRDGCQFLAWITSEQPELDACFYDYCNGHWEAARQHAQMHWNAGHIQNCYEVMCEDFKGVVKIVIVNVRLEPRFEATAKQDPLIEECNQ